MKLFISIFIFIFSLNAKYLTNKSCAECHEKIYKEYKGSSHSKTFFNDELHRKVAQKADKKKYECAVCHMPAANNLKDLMQGKAKPDINNPTHKDAISCYFCHTIAYVKKAHKYNLNIPAKQAKNFKPSFFGNLKNPDETDKHSSLHSPIYSKNACIGCHSHKLNDNNVTIFRAVSKNQDSSSCIKCHMPLVNGGAEKINKRARLKHHSHKFLGIRDKEFRKKGLDINISIQNDGFDLILKNKMPHPLIIQPARAKYFKLVLKDGNKTIWQNYKNNPKEDKKAYFVMSFYKDGKEIIIPSQATSKKENNIEAKSTKILHYKVKAIKNATKLEIYYYLQLAKIDCLKAIDLKDKICITPELIKKSVAKLKK